MRSGWAAIVGILAMLPATAAASPWEDATSSTIGTTAGWSNKVELADVNGDGLVDILFANGGNYSSPGTPEQNGAWLNQGAGNAFTDASDAVFGTTPDLARVIKARDLDGDGDVDLIVGTTYQTQSRLYLGDGSGGFTEVTTTNLPAIAASVGDIAVGDVDGDGDLDLMLADWGAGNPSTNAGGRTMLWVNNGNGVFTDATGARMPDVLVRWSWELELADVDNDWDLDAVISCKSCTGSYLFHNDGTGHFTDASNRLPQFSNNYEFEVMDLDGDDFVDPVTINDGPSLRQHVFIADGTGGYTDETAALWPTSENLGADDNMVVFLDYESDGDADFLIGSLNGSDRLMINDGSGGLTVDTAVITGATTPGTLGIAVADLNGDDKLDVVMSQGEVASPDKVFLGVDVAADTAPPRITVERAEFATFSFELRLHARVHDGKTPTMPHDFSDVALVWHENDAADTRTPMQWYGEHLWRAEVVPQDQGGTLTYRVCATDGAANETCSPEIDVPIGSRDAGPFNDDAGGGNSDGGPDAGPGADGDGSGCGCRVGTRRRGGASWALGLLGLAVALGVRRRATAP